MTFNYNGVAYTVTDDSIYRDFSIEAYTMEEALSLVDAFEGMTDYTFMEEQYSNMVVTKRTIIVTNNIIVNVQLRKRTQREIAQQELEELRSAMSELALTTNKTTTAKINMLLSKGVSE